MHIINARMTKHLNVATNLAGTFMSHDNSKKQKWSHYIYFKISTKTEWKTK